MNKEYSDGSPIFNEDDRNEFRDLLKNGQYEFAMSHAQELIEERQKKLAEDKAKEISDAFDGEIIY